LIATIASSESAKSRPNRASSPRTCRTYGQWRQMNITSSACLRSKSRMLTVRALTTSGSSKSGALVPRASIVEGTATTSSSHERRQSSAYPLHRRDHALVLEELDRALEISRRLGGSSGRREDHATYLDALSLPSD